MARSGGDALKIQEQRGFLGDSELVRNWLAGQDAQRQNLKPDRFCGGETSWISDIPPCMVFTPTVEEFQDPLAYISSIAPKASKQGICKIISPVTPSVPAGRVLMREKPGFKFNTRVQPMSLSDWDCDDNKVTFLINSQRYTFAEFEKMANKFYSRKFCSAAVQPHPFVEAEFWREILSGRSESIQYASDVDGSAFSSSPDDPLASTKWNLKVFSGLPKSTLRFLDTIIPGVTEPMLYIGMLFSMFAWHVEDHYLYSINYHHCGASKTWYGVPGDAAQSFENAAKERVYDSKLLSELGQGAAYDLLIGKTTMFPPSVLLEHGVPVYKAVQNPGEFVLTFPRSYHAGFSHGFNCGEAVNFAMADWFPYGAAACRRYCLLNRMPLLPHEELLWKEAMALDMKATDGGSQVVQMSFLRLMEFQHRVRWLLKSRGAALFTSQSPPVNTSCMLCRHACYVSFLTCRCFPEPTCLNHADEMRRCECGSDRRVILHRDIRRMDELALRIKASNGSDAVLRVVEDGMSGMNFSMALEEDVIDEEGYRGYVPFESIEALELAEPQQQTSVCCSSVITGSGESHADVSLPKPRPRPRPEDSYASPKEKPVTISDEEVLPQKRLSEEVAKARARVSLCFKKQPVPESRDSPRYEHRAVHTSSGDPAFLVKDIVSELKISGAIGEITRGWERAAKSMGMSFSFSYTNNGEMTVSHKAFQRLKMILPPAQADHLDKLSEKISGTSTATNNNNYNNNNSSVMSGVGKRKEQSQAEWGSPSKRHCQSSINSTADESYWEHHHHHHHHRHQAISFSSSVEGGTTTSRYSGAHQLQQLLQQQQHNKRVLTKNGKRVNVHTEEGDETHQGFKSDRDSSSVGDSSGRVIPRVRIKGPSIPPGYVSKHHESSSQGMSDASSRAWNYSSSTSSHSRFDKGICHEFRAR